MPPPRRISRGKSESADPEVAKSTLVHEGRAPRRAPADPERVNKTQVKSQPQENYDDAGPGGSYHTGDYEPYEDLAGAPSISLEGDGLEALDPELETFESDAGDDGDGEASAARDEANETRAGPPLKLEIFHGPDSGTAKKFKGVRMVVGRTPGVDLQLMDQSVSRRHFELIYSEDGVLLKDLGSGNGTKVNGTKVKGEQLLKHGDEIAVGKTKLRLIDEMEAYRLAREEKERASKEEAEAIATAVKKAPAPKAKEDEDDEPETAHGEGEEEPATEAGEEGEGTAKTAPKRTGARDRPVRTSRRDAAQGGFAEKFKNMPKPVRFGLLGLVGVVLLLFIVGVATRPPPPPPVDTNKVTADAKMTEARAAVRADDYALAVKLAAEAEKLVPGIDKAGVGKQAQSELTYVETLDQVRTAITEKRFEDARKLLDNIGRASVKNEEVKAALVIELEKGEVAYKREQVDELLAAGEIDAAKRLLSELPPLMQSEPAQAIAEFERQLEEQQAQDAADSAAAARRAIAAKKNRREEEMNAAFTVVERKFAGSEWDRAASECTRVRDSYGNDKDIVARAKKLQALIPSFGRNFDEGMKKFRAGQKAQAAKPLRMALQQYGQIGLRANGHGQELQEKIADAALIAGKEALIRNDLVTAWQMFREVVKYDPDEVKARQGLNDIAEKAQDLFELGYSQRNDDVREAQKKFKIVVQVTEPGTTVHEKAKNQLAALEP